MIDTADLQAFLEKIQGGTIPVDLLKIGQAHYAQYANAAAKNKFNSNNHHGKFRIALDIEDCLDRFYGGYYSDWACGGQWNRAYQFVRLLVDAFNAAHIELIAFFDGTLKENKKSHPDRVEIRQKTISVLKHIRMIGSPPPKIWWIPPSGLRTCLRNALRSLNVIVVQTVYDHTMEVIDYFHEYKLDGILGLNPDYIIANTSKYYSSHDLRLSYKGALETKEYLVSKLLSNLSLTPDHLPYMAVFLGGYILIDETMLKAIYKKINIDFATDFEARIRKLAEIIRNSPTNDTDEFIRHLSLEEWAKELKESVEYFKRTARFSTSKKFFSSKRKVVIEIQRINENVTTAPLASETNEGDEIARKILQDVSSLVDDNEMAHGESSSSAAAAPATGSSDTNRTVSKETAGSSSGGAIKKSTTFVYALPGEVLKTSLNRHQRGIMDSRIYQLLTKKEIILPQILEDEQYREIPSIHLFYRPARQLIYAILFNLYHQKYLCSKTLGGGSGTQTKDKQHHQSSSSSKSSSIVPEVLISEWIWSPQNEYKKADLVPAVQLPWAVPTIQRLWFGMAFEDKQRRMKAFLSVMRSDTPLMLNRTYVPQHMLVLACVLRYIVTSPDRKILSRLELDAFLATAFSPDINNVDFTQDLVLPGVHLRGVYLATLFMQGVECASLANDACGVPLPWVMTNPWIFFDGKLFHFKLKMSTYVPTLRDLCDNQLDVVIKVDRFRKAILEDVEHFLLPPHMDPLYRAGFVQNASLSQAYGKNAIHSLANIPQMANGSSAYYNSVIQHQVQSSHQNSQNYFGHVAGGSVGRGSTNQRYGNKNHQQQQHQESLIGGYQLKVGGVVVGSWAGGVPNRNNGNGVQARLNRATIAASAGNAVASQLMRYPLSARQARIPMNSRLQRVIGNQHVAASLGRTISRNTYGNNKVNRQRNRNRSRKNERKNQKQTTENTDNNKTDETKVIAGESDAAKGEHVADAENANGTTIQASNLAKSMCHEILKEEDDEVASLDDDGVNKDHLDELLDETNGNISAKLTTLTLNDNNTEATTTATTTTALNGNNVTATNDDTDRMDSSSNNNNNNNNKSKKKSKKGGVNAANTKLSDSNDNKTDEDNNQSTLEANDDASSSADIMKDDVINVNA